VWVLVGLAVAALAIAVRWSHVTAAPLDFAQARQYHALTLAREYYVRDSTSTPEWKRHVARVNFELEPLLEVPILERVAATAYRIVGGERLWIPRLLSSLFWVGGALFLFLLARRFAEWWAALVAVLIYLFFPFPLVASTSFQPDPLMVMLLLAAALAIVRHHEQQTPRRFGVALALAAAAVFVKPGIAAFFVLPLFAALAVAARGTRDALRSRSFYLFPAVVLLPTIALYAYSFVTGRFLAHQPGVEVNPRAVLETFFWRGWLDIIERVLRPPLLRDRAALLVLLVAACGVVASRTKTQLAILLSLWGGYVALALVVSNQTSSHDYYSLPLIPIVALSLALVASLLAERLRALLTRRSAQVVFAALALGVVSIGFDEKAASLHLPRPDPLLRQRVAVYQQIGQLVHHTPRALALDPGGLWYHGWVAGRYWPDQGDLLWERRNDRMRPMSADERFVTRDEHYWPAVGTMRPRPSYFIVAEPFQLVLQPDLCVLLSEHRLIAQSPDYLIFDLTRRQKSWLTSARRVVAERAAPGRYFYRFPPAWSALRPGMNMASVLRVTGRPQHVRRWSNLRKPVEDWFYGRGEKYAITFIGGRLFIKAASSR
jgi:hypothetical protein